MADEPHKDAFSSGLIDWRSPEIWKRPADKGHRFSESQKVWDQVWNRLANLIREVGPTGKPAQISSTGTLNEGGAASRDTPESESNGTGSGRNEDTPGVDLWELADTPHSFVAYPYSLFRRMRRLFATFEIEAITEERTWIDYRTRVQQEMTSVLAEARDIVDEARWATQYLEEVRTSLGGEAAEGQAQAAVAQVSKMHAKVRDTENIALAVLKLRDKGLEARIYETLRKLHEDVQQRWGTWQRRVRTAGEAAAKGLLASLVLQAWCGSLTGSALFLVPALLIPVAAGMRRYYDGRRKVDELINEAIGQLAPFKPDTEIDGLSFRKDRIWGDDRPLDLADETYTRVMTGRRKSRGERGFELSSLKISGEGWARLAIGLVVVLSVVPPAVAWMSSVGGGDWWHFSWPTFAIEASVSEGSCTFAEGRIVWPGPFEVITYQRAEGGLVVVPRERVARIVSVSQGTAAGGLGQKTVRGVSCAQSTTEKAVSPHQIVLVSNTRTPTRGVLLVPFTDGQEPIPCEARKWKGRDGVAVPAVFDRVLARMGEAIRQCRQKGGEPPTIDVRGFASSSKFAGSCGPYSEVKNLELAEARRANVLTLLTGARPEGDAPWRPEHMTIEPADGKRWSSLAHMKDFDHVDDAVPGASKPATENLSQRVEIWFKDLGGCGAAFPSSAR